MCIAKSVAGTFLQEMCCSIYWFRVTKICRTFEDIAVTMDLFALCASRPFGHCIRDPTAVFHMFYEFVSFHFYAVDKHVRQLDEPPQCWRLVPSDLVCWWDSVTLTSLCQTVSVILIACATFSTLLAVSWWHFFLTGTNDTGGLLVCQAAVSCSNLFETISQAQVQTIQKINLPSRQGGASSSYFRSFLFIQWSIYCYQLHVLPKAFPHDTSKIIEADNIRS